MIFVYKNRTTTKSSHESLFQFSSPKLFIFVSVAFFIYIRCCQYVQKDYSFIYGRTALNKKHKQIVNKTWAKNKKKVNCIIDLGQYSGWYIPMFDRKRKLFFIFFMHQMEWNIVLPISKVVIKVFQNLLFFFFFCYLLFITDCSFY